MNQDSDIPPASDGDFNVDPFGNGGGEGSVRAYDDTLPPLALEIHAHSDMSLLPQRSNLASASSSSIGHNVPLPQFSVTGSNSVRPYSNTLPPLGPSSIAVPVAPHDMSDFVSVNDNTMRPSKLAQRWSNTDELTSQNSRQVFNPKQITTPFGEKMEELYSAYKRLDDDSGPINNGSTLVGVKRRAGKEIAPSSEAPEDDTDGHQDAFIIGGNKYAASEINSIMNKQNFTETPRDKTTSPVISADGNDQVLIFGELFTAWQVKRLEGDAKLLELALTDPKKVKKILTNREASFRQKERKEQHMMELNNKIQTLQAENAKMSTQISHIQTVNTQLEKENMELKGLKQFLEQQAQLGDDAIKRLTAEVNRLKAVTGEVSQYPGEAECSLNMQQQQNGTTSQQHFNDALQEIERTLNSDSETNAEFNFDFQLDFE